MMKTILFIFIVLLLIAPQAYAAEDLPSMALELKAGKFNPTLDKEGFNLSEYTGALSFKVLRMLEAGAEFGRISAGETTFHLYPLNVFVLARGKLNEDQAVVPYIGGGWTSLYYKEFSKHANGYHVRAGVQLLLDFFDKGSAFNLEKDTGINNTYFFIEGERIQVGTSDGLDLGGASYKVGLLFEF